MSPEEFKNSAMNRMLRLLKLSCEPDQKGAFLADFYDIVKELPVLEFDTTCNHYLKHEGSPWMPTPGRILEIHRTLFSPATRDDDERAAVVTQERNTAFEAMEWFRSLPLPKKEDVEEQVKTRVDADLDHWMGLTKDGPMKPVLRDIMRKVFRRKHTVEAYENRKEAV